MKAKARFSLVLTLLLLPGLALVALSGAAPAQGGAPTIVAYQGEVRVGGLPHTGLGFFKFAVVSAAGTTTYWSNDGTSSGGGEPTNAIKLDVSDGLFSVLLGDTSLDHMTALPASVFSEPDRYLRVWFNASDSGSFAWLEPDTRIAAVPYALQAEEAANADMVDGLHASELGGTHYQNVVVVAKNGGDYTSVQAAIDSITGATADNPYLVWVAPGVYLEQVTMKAHVHLQGAGQEVTIIRSTTASGSWPPDQATLKLASDTSVRDLTVRNLGTGDHNAGVLATTGTTRTLLGGVTVKAQGTGISSNSAVYVTGSGTGVTLQQVTALAENSSSANFGLVIYLGAAVTLHGGSFTARGGQFAEGIHLSGSGTTLVAEDVTASGENGSDYSVGVANDYATVTLRGGSFTGRGGTWAQGIYNMLSGATLEAEGVTALAEDGTNNMGLANTQAATLLGGSFTGRGGTQAYGLHNSGSGATLDAGAVTALGEDSTAGGCGLYNTNDAAAALQGGSFTGRDGTDARGIYNDGAGTVLEASGVTALGKNGSNTYGLYNATSGAATLRGGSFTGYGGATAKGIYNDSSNTLEATGVTALGEYGGWVSYGLHNLYAAATLHGGSFTARWGTDTYGIRNSGSGATLAAESVVVWGVNGVGHNYGLYDSGTATTADSSQFRGDTNKAVRVEGGAVYLGVSQVDGGVTHGSGTLTCFQVYDGNYAAYTCP